MIIAVKSDKYYDLRCSNIMGAELCDGVVPEFDGESYLYFIDSTYLYHYFKSSETGEILRPQLIKRF